MSTKKKKKVRRPSTNRKEPYPMVVGKPPRPTHADLERARERTPVERAANEVKLLADTVSALRQEQANLNQMLANNKTALASAMLNHQEQSTVLRDLTAIAQPVS